MLGLADQCPVVSPVSDAEVLAPVQGTSSAHAAAAVWAAAAGHLFAEPETLETVAGLATDCSEEHLVAARSRLPVAGG